ncbi:Hydrogen peroxide-inducible genes activator [Alphaproteobacteria bacterium SO-S41]|nr:Hydrogen peroxide-inducible genes activator [Alphaproteobacteria bacterium SO-S41]
MDRLPTLRQLQHFIALSEHLHFGHAAAAIHVTQSTLSASLKELEAILGAPLVDRTKRSVLLTPLGHDIAGRARLLLAEAEDLAQAARAVRAPLSGAIRLGVIPTIAPFVLPHALPPLRKKYPALQLFLMEDMTERLLTTLRDGALDAALIALPFDTPGLETYRISEDPFVVAARKDHPLMKLKTLTPEAVQAEKLLLLRDGHCMRDHALSACGVHASRHDDAFEATSLMTLVQMVDNGLGVTLLPQMAVSRGLLKGTGLMTRPLSGDAPAREIALVWRKGTMRRAEFELLGKELRGLLK